MSWAPPRLDGRSALVTGATRGIGRGVALMLGEAGATSDGDDRNFTEFRMAAENRLD